MNITSYVFPITSAVRPHPDQAAPDDLAVGDVVQVEVEDWHEGRHTLEATVTRLYAHGRVKIELRAGCETRRYSVARADLTLVRRAS